MQDYFLFLASHYDSILSQGSIVSIVPGYGLDDWGVGVQVLVSQEFSLLHFQTGSGVHLIYPMGTGGSFLGVKRPGRETDHLSPTSAEVKNMLVYTSTSPYTFTA
jgi:hypothetical protein